MKKTITIALSILVILLAFTSCQPRYIFFPLPDYGASNDDGSEDITTPTNPWGNNDEIFYDDFTSDTTEYYCPACYKENSTANHSNHKSFMDSFVIEEGKATVYGSSAWLNIDSSDTTKTYTVSYTFEIDSSFGDDDIVAFNFGEQTGWSGVFVDFCKDSGSIKVSSQNPSAGTPTEFEEGISEDNGKYTVSFTAGPNDSGSYEISAIVNGTTIATTTASDISKLYWDIYSPTELNDTPLGYLSNFKISAN